MDQCLGRPKALHDLAERCVNGRGHGHICDEGDRLRPELGRQGADPIAIAPDERDMPASREELRGFDERPTARVGAG